MSMSELYVKRKERLLESGFEVDESGTYAASIFPTERPKDYPRDILFPRDCAWLFYDNGYIFYSSTHWNSVIEENQQRIRELLFTSASDSSPADAGSHSEQ